MPITIEMPRLSDTMEEGTLIKWNVKVGDKVSAGDEIADVETDKATMALSAFDDGTVAKLIAEEGSTMAVGSPIVILAEDGESVEDAAKAADNGQAKQEKAKPESEPAKPDTSDDADAVAAPNAPENVAAASETGSARIRVSPVARKIAEEKGLDLSTIKGSGPDGRIVKKDVLNAEPGGAAPTAASAGTHGQGGPTAPSQTTAPAAPAPSVGTMSLEAKTESVSNMRKTIAKRLVESKTQVPHFYLSTSVSMDALMELRETLNTQLESQGIKLSVNDFITRAVALACLQHPVMNASWTGDGIQYHGTVNVGTAIALPADKGGGLLVATTRDVQNKGLRQISAEIKAIAKKATTKGLAPNEMSDSTITISNLGMPKYGITQFGAIVNPPNAAIIAVGAAIKQPVVKTVNGSDTIAIGHVMQVTLSGDHRVIDGAGAAEYLATLKQMLEHPATLMV